ncbi:MAG TPA: heme exporter protein CcmB [Bacteroidales bacterium]|nr:heme exporter protein CcmB [Bacteroidales bacterium]HPS74153.1 heme exporter protein CcmB [Bacteroidales bacterium]
MNSLAKEIRVLTGKEFRLELKKKYVINGLLLYLLSAIFITYLAFDRIIDAPTWNSLFWVILLFVAVNGVSKSFFQENPARHLYYYTIAGPQAIFLSKILYNMILMLVLSLLASGLFLLFMGNPVVHPGLFIAALLLGSCGLSSILTMVAAIASRAGNNFSLMAILSFPIVLPLLITVMGISENALTEASRANVSGQVVVLVTINIAVVALGYLLFPYLWKD